MDERARQTSEPAEEEDRAFSEFLDLGAYPLILTMRELEDAWSAFEQSRGQRT